MDEAIREALHKAPKMGDAAFVIFCHLYDMADSEGTVIISQRDLAAVTNKSLNTVNSAIKKLELTGLVSITRSFRGVSVLKIQTLELWNIRTSTTTTLINSNNSSSRCSTVPNIRTVEQSDNTPPKHGLTDIQALDMYMSVTGFPYVPPDKRDEIVGAIRAIHYSRNGDTVEYLRPFWDEAVARYGKNTRLFWLSEWATAGEISKGKKKPKQEVFEEH